MSIRSIIRAALAGIARLIVVPVEVMINGVRTIIATLMPARNTASLDVAEDVVSEDFPDDQLAAMAAAREARKAASQVRRSEPERARMAARELSEGRPVSTVLFDPAVAEEAEVLGWLQSLGALHLGMLINARDGEIEDHLRGTAYRGIPMLPADEARAEEIREVNELPDELGWVRILMDRRKMNGDSPDGDQLDDLIAEAKQLVETRARIGDHLPRRVSRGERSYDEAA